MGVTFFQLTIIEHFQIILYDEWNSIIFQTNQTSHAIVTVIKRTHGFILSRRKYFSETFSHQIRDDLPYNYLLFPYALFSIIAQILYLLLPSRIHPTDSQYPID